MNEKEEEQGEHHITVWRVSVLLQNKLPLLFIRFFFSLAMEMLESEFCIQDFNNSCKRPSQPYSEAMIIYTVLSSISLVTVVLNLLVIISISHFRYLLTFIP